MLLMLAIITWAFWYIQQQSKKIHDAYAANELHLIAAMKTAQISLLLQGKRDRVIDFSSDGKIKDSLRTLSEHREGTTTIATLTNHLIANKLPIDDSFYEVYAIDLSGTVIASTNQANVGTNLAHDTIFKIGRERPYVKNITFDPIARIPHITVSAPVFSEGETLAGVIAIKMLTDNLNDLILKDYSKNSVESYIINSERYLVTPSKYLNGDNKGVLAQKIDTEIASNCMRAVAHNEFTTHDAEKYVYINYAGKKTLGPYHIVEEFKWCVIVETEL